MVTVGAGEDVHAQETGDHGEQAGQQRRTTEDSDGIGRGCCGHRHPLFAVRAVGGVMKHSGYLSSTPVPGNVFRLCNAQLAGVDNYGSICV